MKIGTASGEVGRVTRGELALGEYPDGAAVSTPIAIAQGRQDGPVLWVQACVHGPESGAVIGIQRVLRRLDLEKLRGAIVFAAICNPFGFRANERLTPQDGRNLNRVFPGSETGDVSERIAHRLFSAAHDVADAVIDLHTGGDTVVAAHYAIYRDDGSEAGQTSGRIARSLGADKLWNAAPDIFAGAAYLEFARAGMPAILLESGGGARVTPDDLDNFENAILGCCRALGVLQPAGAGAGSYLHGGKPASLRATRGGFFVPSCEAGDVLAQDQSIGTVVDVFGETLETVRCPLPKAWIASMRRPYLPIFAGDELAALIEVAASGP